MKLGELFIKGTPYGISALTSKIKRLDSKKLIKAVSTIKELKIVGTERKLLGRKPADILEKSPVIRGFKTVKVALFDYRNESENGEKDQAFEEFLDQNRLLYEKRKQYSTRDIYTVQVRGEDEIAIVSRAFMVREVSPLPTFKAIKKMSDSARPLPASLPSAGTDPSAYPIVAVVDSGIDSSIQQLQEWIYQRERFVAPMESNTYHGTFVSGIIVWGHHLNSIPEIGNTPCRILDIHILPNDDPTVGGVGVVTEPELLQALEQCLQKYANEVKVWNLSLGTDQLCRLDQFSDFAIQLDELQSKYDVSFVIAAGNYSNIPLLPYPRKTRESEIGRITIPADSVLGITVGSISHTDHPSGTKTGEPSTFSRNGPGPNYIIKPDLVHFGGNAGMDSLSRVGICSLIGQDQIGEGIGTSFSTPFISRQLATVFHTITPPPSPTLARAILTHAARDIRNNGRIKDKEDHYLGFGMPLNIEGALQCSPWMTTLVFQETLRPGYFKEWDYFPYPDSLINGKKYKGEIWMTLAYAPSRNPAYGTEYVETYIETSFGTYHGLDFKGQVPQEHKNKSELYEHFQVENLRKWAPVRTFYRHLKTGVTADRWRLKVKLLCRNSTLDLSSFEQSFVLVLSIADPEKRAPVYDEMSRKLRTSYQTQNILVRPQIKVSAEASA
jgi:serine protease AprX